MGIGLGITISDVTGQFAPRSLFSAGVIGVWFDPSDRTTLFQDVAGTVPVTAAGQSVALMRDKSGNGLHAGQTITAQRPLYQIDGSGRPYLAFDGVDDGLLTPGFSWGSDATTVVAGVQKDLDGAIGYLADFNDYGAGLAGSFALRIPASAGSDVGFSSRGSTDARLAAVSSIAYAAPRKIVATGIGVTSGPLAYVRANGIDTTSNTQSQGATAYGTNAMRIGGRISNPTASAFLGRLYGFIAVNYRMTAAKQSLAESWVNAKTGAY